MTAELAVTFPVVVLALAVVLLAGSLAQAGVSCVDGARAAARALSRGEPHAVAVERARQVLGRPAVVEVSGAGAAAPGGRAGLVTVVVRVDSGTGAVPAWVDEPSWRLPVTCRSHAWLEPRP